MIAIIDCGMGNLRSVLNAFTAIGADARLATPPDLAHARGIVIPGVGAFAEGMARLQPFIAALHSARNAGTPILGICLGLQLMAERSFEHGEHAGLGWIGGDVEAMAAGQHVGWNDLVALRSARLFEGVQAHETFYFVHGFALRARDPAVVVAQTDHGGLHCAAIESGSLFATQFHPEKSQRAGLAVLANFVRAC